MTFEMFGWGFKWSRYYAGGAPGVPLGWWWCLELRYRSPYQKVMGGWRWPLLWCSRSFYFGKEHTYGAATPEWLDYRRRLYARQDGQ